MSPYELVFTETFDEELSEIELFLTERSDQAAKRVMEEVRKHLDLVKRSPYIHPQYPDRPQFRLLVVFRYMIFYRVNEDEKVVEVRHILHGARDLARLLSQ